MSYKILRRLDSSAPRKPNPVTNLYEGEEKGAFCGAEWRYAAPLVWYLQENITNYDVCQECLATEEFALAVLGAI
jgi:hypothetical protein